MKRDFELVKKILIKLEESNEDRFIGIMKVEGYEKEEIDYHLQQMLDACLLKGQLRWGGNKVVSHGVAMHWNGHEFLDAMRNEKAVEMAEKEAEQKGTRLSELPFEVAKSLLIASTKQLFGL